ncbi:hypothetical protein Tco_0866674 [Tanacetum coccineum]
MIHQKHHLGLHLISHPPPPPPAGPFGTSRTSRASGLSQLPPPPLPPSTNQSYQSTSTAALSSSKTTALAEYIVWTTIDTRLKPSVSSIPEDLHMDDDTKHSCSKLFEDNCFSEYDGLTLLDHNIKPTAHQFLKIYIWMMIRLSINMYIRLVMKTSGMIIFLRHTSEGDRRAVRTHMRILSVVRIKVFSLYGYDYMKKIVLRRADLQEYIIAERDFKYLYPSDFEDLYLLNLQGHLNHLPPTDKKILTTVVKLWTRNFVIRQRVEDFQLGIKSYQTQLNLTKPRWDATGFEFKARLQFTVMTSPKSSPF